MNNGWNVVFDKHQNKNKYIILYIFTQQWFFLEGNGNHNKDIVSFDGKTKQTADGTYATDSRDNDRLANNDMEELKIRGHSSQSMELEATEPGVNEFHADGIEELSNIRGVPNEKVLTKV